MLIWKSLSLHACTKYKEEETLHFTFPQVKEPFIFYEVGGLVEFFEPPLWITMAPPTQSSFFLMPPLLLIQKINSVHLLRHFFTIFQT